MTLHICGKHHDWSFHFYGDPVDLSDWRADGLTVHLVENVIPWWVPHWAIRLFCWMQDRFNFKGRAA